MQIKQLFKGAAVAAALATSTAATAGVSANIGVTSEYYFRGVTQGAGAAVQGGVDYDIGGGFYTGAWMSNLATGTADTGFGSYELDLYAGWATEVGGVALDFGVLQYLYPDVGAGGEASPNTLEFYASAGMGPVTLLVAYTDDYFGAVETATVGTEAMYINLSSSFPLSETLSFDAAIGMSSGDGIQATGAGKNGTTDDSYMDLSIGLSKDLGEGMSFGLAYIETDHEANNLRGGLVGSFAYEFDL